MASNPPSHQEPPPSLPTPSPVPPPVPVETHPNRVAFKSIVHRDISDPSRLAPEDAYKSYCPPRLRPLTESRPIGFSSLDGSAAASAAAAALRPAVASLRPPPAIPTAARLEQDKKLRSGSRRRRQPKEWKKLLWVKHPTYPDNYTDPEKFLDHLKRNERLRPYEFWPLVADSIVIVQHVCSVAIFICAYAGIYQDRISPISVVSCGSLGTVLGWILLDYWLGREEREQRAASKASEQPPSPELPDDGSSPSSGGSFNPVTMNGNSNGSAHPKRGIGLSLLTTNLNYGHGKKISSSKHSSSLSKTSNHSISPIESLNPLASEPFPLQGSRLSIGIQLPPVLLPSLSPLVESRLKTLKSAVLIYFALLGLSPILKSLTKSISSDSIWVMATWLLMINIFFFDYGGLYILPRSKLPDSFSPASPVPMSFHSGPIAGSIRAPPFPSSLSTNAALMASTVLASRLTSTTHVFSLTLFSIEVFGLFPVFRRHLRHESWSGHVVLTMALVALSSCGMALILSTSYTHRYGDCGFCWGWIFHVISRSLVGLFLGSIGTAFVMGGCSWWLISLQRYKNVVTGPWDPARPILAGGIHRAGGEH